MVPLLEDIDRLSDYQYGFCPKCSNTDWRQLTAELKLWSDVPLPIFCYWILVKHFIPCLHDAYRRLLLKLEFLGIRGNLLCWLNSFLTCHFQRVIVGGQYSEWTAFNQNRFSIVHANNRSLYIVFDMKQQFIWVGEEMGNEQAKSEVATGFGIQSMDQHLQRKFSKGIQFNSEWKLYVY